MERGGFNWYTCCGFELVHLLWKGWVLIGTPVAFFNWYTCCGEGGFYYIYIYMLWFLISTPVVERVLIGTHVKRMAFNWYTFCGEAVFQLVHLLWRGWFFIGTPFCFSVATPIVERVCYNWYTCCGEAGF